MKAVLLGGFFGFCLSYVGAGLNTNILNMLRLRDMTLAKIIFFAIGFASLLTGISAMVGILDLSHFSVKPFNIAVILGAVIFGIGFSMIGRCPGTCPVAMANGDFSKALVSFIGGLFGAFAYTLVYKYFESMHIFEILDFGKISLFKLNNEFTSLSSISHKGLAIMGVAFMIISLLIPTRIRKRV